MLPTTIDYKHAANRFLKQRTHRTKRFCNLLNTCLGMIRSANRSIIHPPHSVGSFLWGHEIRMRKVLQLSSSFTQDLPHGSVPRQSSLKPHHSGTVHRQSIRNAVVVFRNPPEAGCNILLLLFRSNQAVQPEEEFEVVGWSFLPGFHVVILRWYQVTRVKPSIQES